MESKPSNSKENPVPIDQQIDIGACPFVAREVSGSRIRLDGNVARRGICEDAIVWDTELPGFGLRTRESGYKSWVLKVQERKHTRFITIGPANKVGAREARQQARRLLERIALDGLPQKAGQGRGIARSSPTLMTYLPEFWRDYGGHWKPSTLSTNQAYARRELVPVFGHLTLDAITKADVQRWRDDLSTRGGVFNRALPLLAVMLGYAEQLGYRPKGSNPCKGTPRYKRKLPERYLSTLEYRRLWRVLCEEEAHRPLEVAAIKLLLFTGARTGEIATLRWAYMQGDRLMLPDSKTGPKIVWINAPARGVLAGMRERCTHGLVFASLDGDQPPNLSSFWKGLRRRAALPDVRLHDLRHSFASVAINDGIPLPRSVSCLAMFSRKQPHVTPTLQTM